MEVSAVEEEIGIEVYSSLSQGIGGRIRQFPEDFMVEEILADGSMAKVESIDSGSFQKRGRYLICVLVKRNWDTLRAVQEIGKRLHLDEDRIQIAGIKDARALTAQHVSISRFLPSQVVGLQLRGIDLYPIRFSNQALSPILLSGNQFHIVVRAIPSALPEIERRVKETEEQLATLRGLPNFFGHQRFGTTRPVTHLVGKLLLQGNIEGAAFTFLAHPSPRERVESAEARKQLRETQDFKGCLRYFPKKLKYERFMLQHLSSHPRDFAGAFRRLPFKLNKLFVQAYGSFLFNKSLSQRMKRNISLKEAQAGDYAVYLDEKGLPSTRFIQVEAQSLQDSNNQIKEGRMCLALPVVGFRQSLSSGLQGEIEREILERENVNLEDFRTSLMPEIRTRGGLRIILAPINGLSIEKPEEDPENPDRTKIRFAFGLQRGSYATVLLREFMKPADLVEAGY